MIKLKNLLNEETFTAINKNSGKTSVFKSKDSRDSAVKAGTHSKEDGKGSKEKPKSEKPNMFSKDAGYDAGDGGFGWGGETDRKPATSLPKSASELTYKHAEIFEKDMTAASGLELTTDIDDNSGVIVFTASGGDEPTYQIMIGNNDDYGKPDEFRVSLESTYGNDPAGLGGKVDKTFKSAEEAKKFAGQVAKKYSKEMKMDDGDTNEPKSATGLPSDSKDGYPWSNGDKRMPVDKNVMKSVKKLSSKLGLNNPGRGKVTYAEYEKKMLALVHNALEDANFHGANRQIFADLQGRPELAKRPDYSKAPKIGTPEREEWNMNNSIYNKNFDSVTIPMDDAQDAISDINSQSGWDGEKTLAALLTKMRQDGAGELADRIQTSYEAAMKNNESKSIKLGNLIKNSGEPQNEAITLKSPTFKKLVTYLQKISDESGNDWNDLVKKLESKYARLDTYTSGANPAAYVVNFFYIIKGKDEFVKKKPQDFVKIGNWYIKPW